MNRQKAFEWWLKYGRNISLFLAGFCFLSYALTVIHEEDLPAGLYVLFCLIVLYIFNLERKMNIAEDKVKSILPLMIDGMQLVNKLIEDVKAVEQNKLPQRARDDIATEVFKQVKDNLEVIATEMAGVIRKTIQAAERKEKTIKEQTEVKPEKADSPRKMNFRIWSKK